MGPFWSVAIAVLGIVASGAINYGILAYKLGKHEGRRSALLAEMQRQRKEDREHCKECRAEIEREWMNTGQRFEKVSDGLAKVNERIAGATGVVNGVQYRKAGS